MNYHEQLSALLDRLKSFDSTETIEDLIERIDLALAQPLSETHFDLYNEAYKFVMAYEDKTFQVHGYYTVSNAIGYEVELSSCGEALRTRYTKHDGTKEISEWMPIENEEDEDGIPDAVAKLGGVEIPLSLVMRA